MAANSKRSTPNETKFTEAEKNWNLEKLYEDLRAAKQRCGSAKRKVLTEIEKCHLRGLLCGFSDKEIANKRGVVVGTVSDTLSKTLYRYIEELLDYEEEIRHWSDVRDLLEKAGYKIQVFEQSQPSHSLPNEKENTLEISHKIGATSFLEYFSKSIDQLKSKDLDVRIGAISTLGTLSEYSQPAEHWKIMEYLAAFIRSNARRKEEEEGYEDRSSYKTGGFLKGSSPSIPDDIQAALTIIKGRDLNKDKGSLDLSNTDLREAILTGFSLKGVNFYRANLKGANLDEVNLEGANLKEANLQWAKLRNAKLQKAQFQRANLGHASLYWAELQGANLDYASLEMAYLGYVNLQEARLCNTKLEGTILRKANLERAILDGAILTRAFLEGADMKETSLEVASLEGANLKDAKNLKLEQIKTAFRDSYTVLPDDINARTLDASQVTD